MAGGSAVSSSVASKYLEYARLWAHPGICSMNQNRRPARIIIAATQQPTITAAILETRLAGNAACEADC
jgi:hypothetical protein